jgi:hypothetical protein
MVAGNRGKEFFMNARTYSHRLAPIPLSGRHAAETAILVLLLSLPEVVQGQFQFATNNGTITITKYTGAGGMVTIPDATNGLAVTSIDGWAFSYCTNLTGITIPGSITNIGQRAFESCTSLLAITVDGSNPVYSSAAGVLFNKSQTTLIQCPGGMAGSYTIPNTVITIGDEAFQFCASLTSVTIPGSVTRIGGWSFQLCSTLASVTIPGSVTSMGAYAFAMCASLTNATFSAGDTTTGTGAFWGCSNLTSVTLPSSVTTIGAYVFMNCVRLTGVQIPTNVTEIQDAAFYTCASLKSITVPSSVTNMAATAFIGCISLSAITVDALNPVYSSVDGVLFDKNGDTLIGCPGGKAGSYTIPTTVANIGSHAFAYCTSLSIVIIPDSVTSIAYGAFGHCDSLATVVVGKGVTNLGDWAFASCASLRIVQFYGNAPAINSSSVFSDSNFATVYRLPGTTGWGTTLAGRPVVLGALPAIQMSPQTQTAEAGSAVDLRAAALGSSPLFYLWYHNGGDLISRSTNPDLYLSSVQASQSGAYTVVISNMLGSATSAPAYLNVVAAVQRRPVPGIKLTGETGRLLTVDYADSLGRAPHWSTLGSVSITSTSQYYFDLTLPLPPQRCYRAWQAGTASVIPSLDLHVVPAITLAGNMGASLRVDCINRFGPTDAWVTLDTVGLTNTSQLYFDVSAPGQPQRLYRLVPLP